MTAFSGFGQGRVQLDSLLDVYDRLEPVVNETNVNVCLDLAWEYRDVNADSALFFAKEANYQAESIGFQKHRIKAISFMGIAYRNLGNYTMAAEQYLLALNLSEEHGIPEQRGYSLINLGNLYEFQGNFTEAIVYLRQALDQAEKLDNMRMIGYCYNNLGKSYRGLEDYGRAIEYYTKTILIRELLGDKSGQVSSEIDLAEVYLGQGELDKAESAGMNSFFKLKQIKKPRKTAELYTTLARIKIAQSEYETALKFAQSAIDISEEVSADYELLMAHEVISRIYQNFGDFEKAYDHQVKYSEVKEQLFGERSISQMESLINQNKTLQQKLENEYLRKQDELNERIIKNQGNTIALVGMGLMLSLIAVLVTFRNYRVKKELSIKVANQRDEILDDKKLIEEQSRVLKELDKAKSKFFANVAHDLRSPLSLILGNLEILKNDNSDFSELSNLSLDTSMKNCQRLLFLTDEINDLTRLEEGKIVLKKEDVQIVGYFRMLSSLFVGIANTKGVELRFESELDEDTGVRIDPRQFEKVFYNLVSNAINHTKKGDVITIEISENSQSDLVLNFKDTGVGIVEESLNNIFDRFFQEGDGSSHKGLGIGLALVKEIVDLHGAKISVSSKQEVETKFEICLDSSDRRVISSDRKEVISNYVMDRTHLYDEYKSSIAKSRAKDVVERKGLILIVDRDAGTRYAINQLLDDHYEVKEAAHEKEALELLKTNEVDLIMTGLDMPWMKGLKFMNELDQDLRGQNIPRLLVDGPDAIVDSGEINLDQSIDVIPKPLKKPDLLSTIEKLLNKNSGRSNRAA
ncbi:MAG: tetratricopeptide repeat protein [Cyclobacteriaceae bacterium]